MSSYSDPKPPTELREPTPHTIRRKENTRDWLSVPLYQWHLRNHPQWTDRQIRAAIYSAESALRKKVAARQRKRKAGNVDEEVPSNVVTERPDEDDEDGGCMNCSHQLTEFNNPLLICEGCEGEVHLWCVRPRIRAVPDGDFFCLDCRPHQSKRQRTAPQSKRKSQPQTDEVVDAETARMTIQEDEPLVSLRVSTATPLLSNDNGLATLAEAASPSQQNQQPLPAVEVSQTDAIVGFSGTDAAGHKETKDSLAAPTTATEVQSPVVPVTAATLAAVPTETEFQPPVASATIETEATPVSAAHVPQATELQSPVVMVTPTEAAPLAAAHVPAAVRLQSSVVLATATEPPAPAAAPVLATPWPASPLFSPPVNYSLPQQPPTRTPLGNRNMMVVMTEMMTRNTDPLVVFQWLNVHMHYIQHFVAPLHHAHVRTNLELLLKNLQMRLVQCTSHFASMTWGRVLVQSMEQLHWFAHACGCPL